MKICTKCRIEKELDYFYNSNSIKSGKVSMCKECFCVKQKEYQKNNKDKIAERKKKWRLQNIDKIVKYEKEWVKQCFALLCNRSSS